MTSTAAEGEDSPEQRRSGQPRLGSPRDLGLALTAHPEEDQPHDDDDDPAEAHEEHPVLDERSTR
jgi:hypothetical protein